MRILAIDTALGACSACILQAGEAALLKHLGEEVGARRNELIDSNQLGRTEGFTLVRFAQPVMQGTIVPVTIAGHDGKELLAA